MKHKSINYDVLKLQQQAESAFEFDCKNCGSDDFKILTGKNKGKAQCENCQHIWTWQSIKLESSPERTKSVVPADDSPTPKLREKGTNQGAGDLSDRLAYFKAKYLGESSSKAAESDMDRSSFKMRSKRAEKAAADPRDYNLSIDMQDVVKSTPKQHPEINTKAASKPMDLSDDDFEDAWPKQKLKRKKQQVPAKNDYDSSDSEFTPDIHDDIPENDSDDEEEVVQTSQRTQKKAHRRAKKRKAEINDENDENEESKSDNSEGSAPHAKTRKRARESHKETMIAKNEQKEFRALRRLAKGKSASAPESKSIEEIIETDSDEAEEERIYEFTPLNVFSDEEDDAGFNKKKKRSRVAPALENSDVKNPRAHYVPRPGNKFNAYFLFNSQQRKLVHKENPELTPSQISKIVSDRWKNLPADEKEKYKEEARTAKEKWKEAQGLNKLRVPPNGYVLFSNSIFREIKRTNPEYDMGQISAIIGARWKQLEPEKKKEFNDKSLELRNKFKEEHPEEYQKWAQRRNRANKATRDKNKYLQ